MRDRNDFCLQLHVQGIPHRCDFFFLYLGNYSSFIFCPRYPYISSLDMYIFSNIIINSFDLYKYVKICWLCWKSNRLCQPVEDTELAMLLHTWLHHHFMDYTKKAQYKVYRAGCSRRNTFEKFVASWAPRPVYLRYGYNDKVDKSMN